jgi:hypothetical protein
MEDAHQVEELEIDSILNERQTCNSDSAWIKDVQHDAKFCVE